MVYLQQTIDIEFGTIESFKMFSEKVDIIWFCGFDPCEESLNYVDKEKVIVCAISNSKGAILNQFQGLYYFHHLYAADSFLRYENKHRRKKDTNYPKDFSNEEFCKLLSFLVSSEPLSYEQWEKQETLYKLNDHRYAKLVDLVDKTPFQIALMKGDKISVQELLHNDIDLNEQVFRKVFQTFIHSGSPDLKEIVEILLGNGLEANLWFFMYAANAGENEIAEILADNGALENYDGHLGHITAFSNSNRKLTEVLIEKGVDVNEKDDHGVSAIEKAAFRGWTEIVDKMCSIAFANTKNDINEHIEVLSIKLHCMMNNVSNNDILDAWMTEELENCELSQRKEIVSRKFLKNWSMKSSFSIACEKGNIKLIEYFITVCNADIDSTILERDLPMDKNFKATSIGVASAYGQLEAVKTLIKHGADVDSVSYTLNTPVLLSCMNNHFEVAKYLVKNGADISKPNIYGKTCLMCSVASVELCQFLLEQGADVNAKDNAQKTAKDYAIEQDQLESTKLLLKHGADTILKSED